MTTRLPRRLNSGYRIMLWTKSKPPPQPQSITVRTDGSARRTRNREEQRLLGVRGWSLSHFQSQLSCLHSVLVFS